MNNSDALLALAIGMTEGPAAAIDGVNKMARSRANANCQIARQISQMEKLQLQVMGIKFKEKDDSNSLLQEVTLPEGWTVKSSDHYMYSHIYDEKNRKRVMLGLKHSDNWASIQVLRRFNSSYTMDKWVLPSAPEASIPTITDQEGKILWRGSPVFKEGPKDWEDSDRARRNAYVLLHLLYPKSGNAEAYWDIEPEFPPNESEEPKGMWFDYNMTLYRDREGRNYCDSGTAGARLYKDTNDAIKTITADLKNNYIGSYQCVKYVIKRLASKTESFGESKEVIKSGEILAPAPKEEFSCFGFDHSGPTYWRKDGKRQIRRSTEDQY